MRDLYGLATGIGSLPHKTAAAALEIIFRHLPEVPHWPQLPAAGEEEGFVRQYLSPLSASGLLHIASGRSPYFTTDASDWLERQTEFYEKALAAETGDFLTDFALPRSAANGFYSFAELLVARTTAARYIKGQLSGPVTLGLQLTDVSMQPAFYRDDLRELLVTSLSMQLRWQVGMLAAAGLPVIVFIDEPGILCFGQSSFVGLSREAIQGSLHNLVEAAHQAGALVGVHACAGVDWSLLFELPFDIVNVDVYHYFPSLLVYTDSLRLYLERGGILAWGLVPTSAEVERETAHSLLLRLEEYLKTLGKKGIDPALLVRQLIFTPSCGTGTLSAGQAEKVYSLLQEISLCYQSSFVG
jgi:methionine synthase II (cobalamin-independent)